MNRSIRVVNSIALPPKDVARLGAISPLLEVVEADEDALDYLDDPAAEIVLAHSAPPATGTPRLRWLQLSSAGVNHMSGSDIWSRGVTVTNARGVYAAPMAEYVMTAVLSASQRVAERRELQLRREWPSNYIDYECYGVRDRTMVIVGYGTVGRETARLATAFGMRVLAVKAHPEKRTDDSFRHGDTGDPDGTLPAEVSGLDQLGDFMKQADYLVLTLPLTPHTEGIIGRQLLAQLRPGAWVVNVGRGKVIDEQALVDSLKQRQLAGAWLDVFAEEPLLPDSPLWTLPNVTITPHLSGGNRDSLSVLTDLCCANLERYLAGKPLLNVVRPELGY